MAWDDRLQTASWRGIEFFIDSHNFGAGLNTVNHEFPDRDKPFTEDLGRKSRTFSIQGHILGDSYFSVRDELIAACEQPGAGELIHPYLGSRVVKCTNLRISEDTKKGRFATVSFDFIEAGDVSFPRPIDDKKEILEGQVEASDEAAIAEFEDSFSITGLPGQLVDSARDQVAEALDNFEESTQFIQNVADDAAELSFSIRNFRSELDTLLSAPDELASRLKDSISQLTDTGLTARDGFQAASFLFDYGSSSTFKKVSIDTPSRNQQNANTDALTNFIRRIAVSAAAQQAVDAEFLSIQEALRERDNVNAVIEEQVQLSASDDLYQNLRDISATFTDAVPDQDSDLPNIVEIELKTSRPSLVIVYDLFESLDPEQDLIDRNNVRHPGFVLGGQTIEVLGNG